MAQTLTFLTDLWRDLTRRPLSLSIDIDHDVPGSHLIWDIENSGDAPVTVTKLIVRGQNEVIDTVALEMPHVLAPKDRLILPMDVDWTLLHAKSVAVVDIDGGEHEAPRRQLAAVCEQIRESIDRPAASVSAHDFLSGAADLVFGVVILGLGFFMLMYAIATG